MQVAVDLVERRAQLSNSWRQQATSSLTDKTRSSSFGDMSELLTPFTPHGFDGPTFNFKPCKAVSYCRIVWKIGVSIENGR